MKNLIYTLDKAQAVAFGLLGLGCIYGVIAKGAWWHIGTAAICAVMAVALWKDDIGNEDEEDLE
ncbi:MAG: hypothetical protein IKO23_09625 [Bacteroidales bacterium]|nr:hypothetical protein [Bacteroidales bacterium]